MNITQTSFAAISHKPKKNDIISVAHILENAVNIPFDHVSFGYTDRLNVQHSCRGYDFSRNFVDCDYRSAFVSAHKLNSGLKIDVLIVPSHGCTLTINTSSLTEAQSVDLLNALGEQLSSILSPEPPLCDEQNSNNNNVKKHKTKGFSAGLVVSIIMALIAAVALLFQILDFLFK